MESKKESPVACKLGKFSIALFVVSVLLFLTVVGLYVFVMPARIANSTIIQAESQMPDSSGVAQDYTAQ